MKCYHVCCKNKAEVPFIYCEWCLIQYYGHCKKPYKHWNCFKVGAGCQCKCKELSND